MVSAAARYGPSIGPISRRFHFSEPARNLVVDAEGSDEDEALDARGCHRLDDPFRLRVEVASEIRVDDVLAANGRIELLPVKYVAFHYSGSLGRICELARVTHEERQFDV